VTQPFRLVDGEDFQEACRLRDILARFGNGGGRALFQPARAR
jgi:hypothetical protein